MFDIEMFWRHRPRISLEYMAHHLRENIGGEQDGNDASYPVLRFFLQRVCANSSKLCLYRRCYTHVI